MKIAFIVGTFPALSETFILDQITGLLDLGHEVEVFAEQKPEETKSHFDVEKYHLSKRTSYYPSIPAHRFFRQLVLFYMVAKKLFVHPACTFKALMLYPRRRKELSPRTFFWLLSFIGKKFDLYHSHFGPNGNKSIHIKIIGIPGKHLTTFHGSDVNQYPRLKGTDVYRELFQKADLFTANTVFTRSRVTELGANKDKIQILPVGLRMERFAYKRRDITSGETIKLLTVGRLVEKKGHEYALKALAQVSRKHPNIAYDIAGDGPLRSKLEALAVELKISSSTNFLGAMMQDEIIKLYQSAHIFILPSVTAADGDMEGQGLVLQEAQAVGLPVISTLHNGIPDGVLDGRSGFLVPERDADALAERLQYLIEHPEIWAEMGRAGREFVEKNYDIKKLNRRLVQIYQQLLQKN